MRNIFYYFITVLFALVSCEKDLPETELIEAKQVGDELTQVDLAAKKMKTTVVGTGIAAQDVAAVQEAVDDFDHVTLSGTFDFGTDEYTGGVVITRENVVLKGPATILNGAKYQFIPGLGEVRSPIAIIAPGVEIRELELTFDFDGILVNVEEGGKPVIVEGNTIFSQLFGAGVAVKTTPGGIRVLNNTIESFINYYASETTGSTEIANNDMVAGYDCVFLFPTFNNKLDIINNDMHVLDGGFEGMFIGSWRVTSSTGPEWGDNPPVRIVGNTVAIEGMDAAGIIVGTSISGINNVLVKDNTIRGTAGFSGLLKEPYGRNNRFINNDLSGLSTYGPQILVMGGTNNHYQNNKLGTVLPIPEGSFGSFIPAWQNTATLVAAFNWHENDGLDSPDPLNRGNHFSNNDYTMTGVAGWSEDPESFGAVLLLNFLQKLDADGNPFQEDFVMENFVNEKRFPEGTDVCNQVLDLNPGANKIAGAKACGAKAKKTEKQLLQKQYENFNKRLMERNQKRERILKEKRNKKS